MLCTYMQIGDLLTELCREKRFNSQQTGVTYLLQNTHTQSNAL
ncbi:hypothetical protein SAMN04488541_10897 [Thermoflexibacter ruber]|uniref:Uncharacterized protein n=1 Tax=Thermoflexibacter ruber TaxID=1003 RepID=A0A1I2K823_9BACT|nr:hypothetical protein SAMN04488541_10897 [Thermoflexibacter ruber]